MARSRCFIMAFSLLQLSEPILRSLKEEGYTTPTPIQAKAIPPILEGRDVLGCAQTGTGKTAAFALPILHKLMTMPVDKTRRGPAFPRALVLSPTRELAEQIGDSFATYGRHTGLVHTCVYGGVSQYHQVRALHRGVDILVATPGRLEDLMEQRVVNLSEVCVLVLDEADRMLDMGFIQPIRRIASALPNTKERPRHTLLFSATMPKEIMHLADSLLKDPVKVAVTPVASAVPLITQSLYLVSSKNEKQTLLHHLLNDKAVQRAVVFTKTKFGADRVSRKLKQAGIKADEIHGNKAQNQRQRALDAFRDGRTRVLVATDVAARGLDVDAITHVFNFDMPMEPESYVHRIGRTGRAGATGLAVSFCDKTERGLLRSVERLIGKQIPTVPVPQGMVHVDGSPEPIESFTTARGASGARGHSDRSPAPRSSSKGRGNDGGRDFTRPEPQRSASHSTGHSHSASPAASHVKRDHHPAKPGEKATGGSHTTSTKPAASAPAVAPSPKPVHVPRAHAEPAHAPASRSAHTPRMPMTDPIIERPEKNYDYSEILAKAPSRGEERVEKERPAAPKPTHAAHATAPAPKRAAHDGPLHRPAAAAPVAPKFSAGKPHTPRAGDRDIDQARFSRDEPAPRQGRDDRGGARFDPRGRSSQNYSTGGPKRDGYSPRDDRGGFGGRDRRDTASDYAPRSSSRPTSRPASGPAPRVGTGAGPRTGPGARPAGKPDFGFDRDAPSSRFSRDDRGAPSSRFARDDRGESKKAAWGDKREGAARPAPFERSGPAGPRPLPGAKPSKTGLHPHASKVKPKFAKSAPVAGAGAGAKKTAKKSNKKPHRKGAPPSRPFAGGGSSKSGG